MKNNFSEALVHPQGLRLQDGRLQVTVRLPWYRSMPLSVIEISSLRVDGQPVPAEAMRLEVNGKSFALHELAERTDEWWYVLDDAVLHADLPTLHPGQAHRVELTLGLRPPYIPHLHWVTQCERTLQAQ